MISHHLLTLLVFLPSLGALLILAVRKSDALARLVALGFAVAELVLSGYFFTLDTVHTLYPAPAGFFQYENVHWIDFFGIRYTLGMDGISLLMVALTAFITVIGVGVSWQGIKERVPLHFALLLLMESGILGVFLALDLFLFYLFWEVMLIPMFFLIGIWGHGRRIYSAVKFFLYTFLGSLLMLVAIITIFLMHGAQSGTYSFALVDLIGTKVPYDVGLWLFAAFLLAFAIKFPLFPLHTWLPDAHTDAPTAGSVILASLLLKTGAYGLVRFGYPLFPDAARAFTPLIYAAAVFGISYGAWIAFAQKDMKRLVAYSSVSHMGFVALGIAAWSPIALSGAILQMVNHGVTTGALFALVGMLDERTHSREIDTYGGVWGKVPALSFFFLLFCMASAGLPGLNNFVGEFLVLIGTFKVAPLPAGFAFLGMVLTLVYTVRLVQEILFGKERKPLVMHDLSLREGGILAVLAVGAVYLGVSPSPLLELVKGPVALLVGVK
ncbi:complex I subunit 4 family protein [Geomesophilobacter sediminis]|uniref:NADH-quinone oxidoreductase subunit M n=1 Tax=Geomesophilobacter sediminis TaxID=2798584 RepID=A0A8J7IPT7_9BACT|nr:NADH-quinone oxidoreductase subunit M [Geomesophilobacter sediminis]MBJ6725688.1 NADH-quinone oxidoreductase subunit M [Geomesophilobacter sediminis]